MSDPDPWWPDGFIDPAFVVQRQIYGTATGGDYVRGSSVTTLPSTALRYPTSVAGFDKVLNKAFLFVRAFDYVTAEIAWGWPIDIKDIWLEVALVRSGVGTPTTPMDGQTVFRAMKTDFQTADGLEPGPIVYDQPLQSGQFYYYSLFFRTGPFDWVVGQSSRVLIPRNFRHAEHLWNAVPPFYQWTDDNTRGHLRQFLSIFGFEMDQTREYVEQWQETYHVDKAPMPLLRRAGQNFGVPYRSGVGEARYRSLMAALPTLLEMRGTPIALQQVVQAGTKWACDVTTGTNLMLLPDDSDFAAGTGDWATLHPVTDALVTYSSVDDDEVFLDVVTSVGPPIGYGRGVMRAYTLKTLETANLSLTCGDGILLTRDNVIPLYTGVPVKTSATYGFSIQIKEDVPCVTGAYILWFGAGGQPSSYISAATPSTLLAPGNTNWNGYSVQGTAPANAVYAVPMVSFTSRPASGQSGRSGYYYLAGASVYLLNSVGQLAVAPPDSYLTLGDPTELIGDAQKTGAPGTFKEYIMGTTNT